MSLGDVEVESNSDDGSVVSSGISEESSSPSRSAGTKTHEEQSQHSHSSSINEESNASIVSDDEPQTEEGLAAATNKIVTYSISVLSSHPLCITINI